MAGTSTKAGAAPSSALTFGEFYDAILASPELAAYVIRIEEKGSFVFEDANDVVMKVAGKPLSEIRGRTPEEVLVPEIAECLTSNLQRCVETGLGRLYHRTFDFPSGRVSFKTNLIPVTRGSASVQFVVGLTRDVTHESNLIENAQHNAALLRALGIAIPAAVYILDMDTRTLKFIGGEASASQLAWRQGAEGVGSIEAMKFFHPGDHHKVQAHWADLASLPDGEVITIDYRLLASQGEYRRHTNREIVFSRDSQGNVRLVLGVSEDVSAHDRMEQEVRDLSARMLTLQMDERRRIAEELHDSTGQHLTAAVLALGNAKVIQRKAPDDKTSSALLAAIDDAADCVAEAQREIRVLSYLLHPPSLRSGCLGEALTNFTRGFAKRARLKITIDVTDAASRIDDDTAVHLLRICQEALTNVYRHANARKAAVRLEVDERAICLTVTDDGIGFDDSANDILGVGLPGMRERITRMGGTFRIGGSPEGTTLTATLPPPPRRRRSPGSRAKRNARAAA